MTQNTKFLLGILGSVIVLAFLYFGLMSPTGQMAQVYSSQRNSTEIESLTRQVEALKTQIEQIEYNQTLSNLSGTLPTLIEELQDVVSGSGSFANVLAGGSPPTTNPIVYPTREVKTDPATGITTIRECTAPRVCIVIIINPNGPEITVTYPGIPAIYFKCDRNGNCKVRINLPGTPTICTGTLRDGVLVLDCDYVLDLPGDQFDVDLDLDIKVYVNEKGQLCIVKDGVTECKYLHPDLIPYLIPMFPGLKPEPPPTPVTPVPTKPTVPTTPAPTKPVTPTPSAPSVLPFSPSNM